MKATIAVSVDLSEVPIWDTFVNKAVLKDERIGKKLIQVIKEYLDQKGIPIETYR